MRSLWVTVVVWLDPGCAEGFSWLCRTWTSRRIERQMSHSALLPSAHTCRVSPWLRIRNIVGIRIRSRKKPQSLSCLPHSLDPQLAHQQLASVLVADGQVCHLETAR